MSSRRCPHFSSRGDWFSAILQQLITRRWEDIITHIVARVIHTYTQKRRISLMFPRSEVLYSHGSGSQVACFVSLWCDGSIFTVGFFFFFFPLALKPLVAPLHWKTFVRWLCLVSAAVPGSTFFYLFIYSFCCSFHHAAAASHMSSSEPDVWVQQKKRKKRIWNFSFNQIHRHDQENLMFSTPQYK